MDNKTVLITGANAGIGFIAARALAGMGAHVILVCRNEEKARAAMDQIREKHPQAQLDLQLCDLSSQASIRKAGLALREKYDRIDVLLNNAGGMFGERALTEDGLEYTFALDHMGYFLLTHYLLDLVKASEMKRIVNVSSEAHRFVRSIDWENLQGEKKYSEFPQYGLVKLFNLFFTRKLAREVAADGITVNALHPGFVNTNFGSGGSFLTRLLLPVVKLFAVTPEQGAATSIYLASSLDPAVRNSTGEYFAKKKITQASDLAADEAAQEKLWQISLELGKVNAYGKVEVEA